MDKESDRGHESGTLELGTQLQGKVLVVGMADSVHLARWISQFSLDPLKFLVISSSPHRRLHPLLSQSIDARHTHSSVSIPFVSKWLSLPLWILDRFCGDLFRGMLIAYYIRRFKPSLIHVNELQNAGYATIRALKLLRYRDIPPVFTTNYGSELVWFGRYEKHRKKLVELLKASQGFSAECRRDYRLARELGFNGVELPQMPVAGGMRLETTSNTPRSTIAVKGYQNKWGRALTVLSAIDHLKDEMYGYKVEVFSANRATIKEVRRLKRQTSLEIVAYPKGALSHSQMMTLYSRSLLYVGFSLSDGISTSMIEAMSNGAIPIQTCTACADEWITHDKTGFILEPEDKLGLERSLLKVLSGDFDTEGARQGNYKVIKLKYDPDNLRQTAREQYARMLMVAQ